MPVVQPFITQKEVDNKEGVSINIILLCGMNRKKTYTYGWSSTVRFFVTSRKGIRNELLVAMKSVTGPETEMGFEWEFKGALT